MLIAQSSLEFHQDTEIERTFKKRRQLFKSKTNLNLEELDPYFIQSYNSNKSNLYEDSSINMADNNNTIDMTNDKARSIKEYAVFDPTTFHTSIVRA